MSDHQNNDQYNYYHQDCDDEYAESLTILRKTKSNFRKVLRKS